MVPRTERCGTPLDTGCHLERALIIDPHSLFPITKEVLYSPIHLSSESSCRISPFLTLSIQVISLGYWIHGYNSFYK